ncbi:hypothetical protein [Flavobacterium sp.]|nr:hypothetical protein [Flavobacterium sp.]
MEFLIFTIQWNFIIRIGQIAKNVRIYLGIPFALGIISLMP